MKKALMAALAALLCGCSEAAPTDTSADAPLSSTAQTSSAAATTTEASAEDSETPVTTSAADTSEAAEATLPSGILSAKEDLALTDTDGMGSRYEFTYGSERFSAVYTPDNWKIIDSYKITNEADMALICEALTDEHPIHGRDMISYRVPEDMVYEWKLHNFAYSVLPESAEWKQNAKDVDLDPEDQGRNLYEIYRSRVSR